MSFRLDQQGYYLLFISKTLLVSRGALMPKHEPDILMSIEH